jgi:hypothetical protein
MERRENRFAPNPRTKSNGKGRFSQKGHLNAAIRKKSKNMATSKRPHKASLFAFATTTNSESQLDCFVQIILTPNGIFGSDLTTGSSWE